ncbi:MAG: VOC family protein [Pseudonocardiaceae bacterium]|nr:VOC family protein [Pseudonocardiaceae bacterium]
MSMSLGCVVIDARAPVRLAEFWAALLGRRAVIGGSVETDVWVPASERDGLDLIFTPAVEGKETKNRLHLDLRSGSDSAQAATVRRALELGARSTDIGQGAVPWTVLADPEGNEFCVLELRASYANAGAVAAVVVDAANPGSLATFWCTVTGRSMTGQGEQHADPTRPITFIALRAPRDGGTELEFLRSASPQPAPSRVHLGVYFAPGERSDVQLVRLRAMGARFADRRNGRAPWTALADPEGNEFCVLQPP